MKKLFGKKEVANQVASGCSNFMKKCKQLALAGSAFIIANCLVFASEFDTMSTKALNFVLKVVNTGGYFVIIGGAIALATTFVGEEQQPGARKKCIATLLGGIIMITIKPIVTELTGKAF